MKGSPAANLYMLNFALIFAHEIDSAYWREWELFGIPGGVQLFVLLNLGLLLVALYGFRLVLADDRRGNYFALLLAAGGLFAFGIHAYFLANGRPEFGLPVSVALLLAIGVVSAVQAVLAVSGVMRSGRRGGYQSRRGGAPAQSWRRAAPRKRRGLAGKR